jgi:outer membrane protein, heavy metal efflux system
MQKFIAVFWSLALAVAPICLWAELAPKNSEVDGPHQENPLTLTLSAQEALLYGLQHNKEQSAWKSLLLESEVKAKYTGVLDAPELHLSYATDALQHGEGYRTTTLGVSQAIPLGQHLRLEKNTATIESYKVRAQWREFQRTLTQDIELALGEIEFLSSKKNIIADMLANNHRLFSFLDSRAKLGEVSVLDVGEAQLELDGIQQDSMDLERQEQQQLSALQQLLGIPKEQTLSLRDAVASDHTWNQELAPVTRTTFENHPLVELQRLQLNAAKNDIGSALAQRWGDLSVGLTMELEREPSSFGVDHRQSFGLELSLPFPLRKPYQGNLEASILAENRHTDQHQKLIYNLEQQERALRQQHQHLRQQIEHLDEHLLKKLAHNLELTEQAYAQGHIDLIRLMRMHSQSLLTQTRRLELLKNLNTTRIQWQALTANHMNPISKNLP